MQSSLSVLMLQPFCSLVPEISHCSRACCWKPRDIRKQVGEAEWQINKSLSVWRLRSSFPKGWAKSFQTNNRDACVYFRHNFSIWQRYFQRSSTRLGLNVEKGWVDMIWYDVRSLYSIQSPARHLLALKLGFSMGADGSTCNMQTGCDFSFPLKKKKKNSPKTRSTRNRLSSLCRANWLFENNSKMHKL